MELTLTDGERDELAKVIQWAITDLRVEIRRTDNQPWREDLHTQERLLKSLLERLKTLDRKEAAVAH